MAVQRQDNLASLSILRGGAAVYVAAYHSVAILTSSGRRFHEPGGPARMILRGNLLGLLGFGRYAVLAFFVLSGFVIHLRQAEHPEQRVGGLRRTEWAAAYGWRRSMRIYPPLLAAVALTAAITLVGFRLFPDLYGHLLTLPGAEGLVARKGTLNDIRRVLVPVEGGGTYSSNGSLWSVGYELWFYLAYVPVLFVLVSPLRRRTKVPMGLVLGGSVAFALALIVIRDKAPLPGGLQGLLGVAIYFPVWVAGAVLAEVYACGTILRRRQWVAASACLCLVIAAAGSDNEQRPAVDVLWVLGIWLFIAVLTLRPASTCYSGRAGRWAASASPWSYSLYLVHMPVICLAYGAWGDGTQPVTNPLVVVAAFASAIAVGWLFYLTVERPSLWLLSRPPAAIGRERLAVR